VDGRVTEDAAAEIARAWAQRLATPQKTRLGGGIGLHGWSEAWKEEDGTLLSWGCVVMHNEDIRGLYPRIGLGTMVVLLP
jgi:lipoprotein-anchoring transpeptidase ErfK/SrfK